MLASERCLVAGAILDALRVAEDIARTQVFEPWRRRYLSMRREKEAEEKRRRQSGQVSAIETAY